MLHQQLLVALAFLSFTSAAPRGDHVNIDADPTLTTTISATHSYTLTITDIITLPTVTSTVTMTSEDRTSSSTTTSTSSKPTYTATEIYAFRPNSPVHLLPFQAAGAVFRLGGSNAAYCPSYAERSGACDDEETITGINNCSMSVTVPGGQDIYLAPDGSLRYTPPHSVYMVPGSLSCPLSFTKAKDSDASEVMVAGFVATGLMACPMLSSKRVPQQWQVYANTLNASVPLRHGNSSSCWVFEAVGIEKQISHYAAAWEYA